MRFLILHRSKSSHLTRLHLTTNFGNEWKISSSFEYSNNNRYGNGKFNKYKSVKIILPVFNNFSSHKIMSYSFSIIVNIIMYYLAVLYIIFPKQKRNKIKKMNETAFVHGRSHIAIFKRLRKRNYSANIILSISILRKGRCSCLFNII